MKTLKITASTVMSDGGKNQTVYSFNGLSFSSRLISSLILNLKDQVSARIEAAKDLYDQDLEQEDVLMSWKPANFSSFVAEKLGHNDVAQYLVSLITQEDEVETNEKGEEVTILHPTVSTIFNTFMELDEEEQGSLSSAVKSILSKSYTHADLNKEGADLKAMTIKALESFDFTSNILTSLNNKAQENGISKSGYILLKKPMTEEVKKEAAAKRKLKAEAKKAAQTQQ